MSFYYNRDNLFNFVPVYKGPPGDPGQKGLTGDTANIFDINGDLNMNDHLIYNLNGLTFSGNTFTIESNSTSIKLINLDVNNLEIGTTFPSGWNILRLRAGATQNVSTIIDFANPIGYTIDDNNPQWLFGRKFNSQPNSKLHLWRFALSGGQGGHRSSAITIDSSNRVGIQQENPEAALDLFGGPGNTTYLIAGTGDTANRLRFTSSGIVTQGAVHSINAPSQDGMIIFQTRSAERLRIDNIGNIGIGITDNTIGATLDINGSNLRLRVPSTINNSSDAGFTGEMRWDDNNFYIRVSNVWKKIPLTTF
jgi:hypothetical protein